LAVLIAGVLLFVIMCFCISREFGYDTRKHNSKSVKVII
jgi:hypothetical protein